MRQFSFGGSEVSNLMGIGKKRYKTQKEFIIEKYQQ
jgi:predicted phage-related endonuclease